MIRREDRISTVLDRDPSLIDVLVALSPAFKRLRNRAMRKVMSRLVTVEQAAAMADLDPDVLVARLNAHRPDGEPGGGGAETGLPEATDAPQEAPTPSTFNAPPPPALARIPDERRREIDVRAALRAGEEPFSQIMAARREVPPGGALAVRATFEPVPLYAVMRRQGLAHHTEHLDDEDWRVWFFPADDAADPDSAPGPNDTGAETSPSPGDDGVVILDVRGLEPPEPLMRTLAALETLPAGGTLVQLNVRVPQFLLPILEERGFRHEIREQHPDLVRLFIRRTADDPAPDPEHDR